MITRFLDWALQSSDDMTMPQSWLADTERLAAYSAWTERENESWIVAKDTAATQRDKFWERLAQREHAPLPANVERFNRKAR